MRRSSAILAVALLCGGGAWATDLDQVRGYIDATRFIDAVGDESVTVEVNLKGALLRTLLGVDPELKRLAGGLESIQAVIAEVDDSASWKRAIDLVRDTERRLLEDHWERLVRVKERGESDIKILVLSEDENIHGLVVMMLDHGSHEIVFVNVAGVLDLGALQRLSSELDLPGLGELDFD